MLAKALAISVVAALLGPAIGIGVFLTAEPLRDKAGSPQARVADPVTESNQAGVIRTFAPPGLWSTPATTQQSPDQEPWRHCSELFGRSTAWRECSLPGGGRTTSDRQSFDRDGR